MAEREPFIPYADRGALPESLAAPLAAYEARMGFMPNALKLYMHRPEILAPLVRLNDAVMREPSSRLDAGLKRRIAAVCSFVNRSAYCVAHNVGTLTADAGGESEGWSCTDDEVRRLLDPSWLPDDPAERTAVRYARAAAQDPTRVPRELLAELAEHLTPPQIVELACVVGFWTMYNSIHEALRVPLEPQLRSRASIVDG